MTEQSRTSSRNTGEPPFGLAQGKTDVQTLGLLYKFLKRMVQGTKGIPGGWKNTPPPPILAGVAGDATAGTEAASWLAADAQGVVLTAIPAHPTGATALQGTATTVLRSDATIQQGIVTTKGDLLGRSSTPERVPVGANGDVLTADSTVALGVSWKPASSSEALADDSIFYAHSLAA